MASTRKTNDSSDTSGTGSTDGPDRYHRRNRLTDAERERFGAQFGAWFRESMQRSGKNVPLIAAQAEISTAILYAYKNDGTASDGRHKHPARQTVIALSEVMGADLDQGLRAAGYEVSAAAPVVPRVIADLSPAIQHSLAGLIQQLTVADMVLLPVVGSASAGAGGIFAEANIRERIPVPRGMIRRRPEGNCFVFKVVGNCLENAHIIDGDQIILEQVDDAEDGDIVTVATDDEIMLKRLCKTTDTNGRSLRWLETDEPGDRNRIDLGKVSSVRIFGRMIGMYREA